MTLLRLLLLGLAACDASPSSPDAAPMDAALSDAALSDAALSDASPSDGAPADSALGDAVSDATSDVVSDADMEGVPATLSLAGLFASGVSGAYAPGVRSYDVRFPLWTDDADKARHVLLPEGEVIDVSDADHWAFPVGTRIFKEFRVDGVPVETRLLWKRDEDFWVYVSYVYRADGSDADAAPEGATNVLGTQHDVPTQAQCRGCHQGADDFVLGLGAVQLARDVTLAWAAEGVLPAGSEPAVVPGDEVQQAALGYLHANCGHCHGENHPVSRTRSLRLWLPVGVADAMDAPAWQTSAGVRAFHDIDGSEVLVVPGDPDASQLWLRMGVRGDVQMPPLGTGRVDDAGLAAVRAWIAR